MPKKKKSGAALIDDELILKCKFWKVPMRFAPPKEKPDAALQRQALVKADLDAAEKEYNRAEAELADTMKDWFFHRSERRHELSLST